jgi:hypothetical protein
MLVISNFKRSQITVKDEFNLELSQKVNLFCQIKSICNRRNLAGQQHFWAKLSVAKNNLLYK